LQGWWFFSFVPLPFADQCFFYVKEKFPPSVLLRRIFSFFLFARFCDPLVAGLFSQISTFIRGFSLYFPLRLLLI